jgi:hypothetical protein
MSIGLWNMGGRSVMIWGCMTTFGLGAWYKIESRMDKHPYKFIWNFWLWSTLKNYNLDPNRLAFQHDNDPKHTSKTMPKWLASQPFEFLQWSAQSPDLIHLILLGISQTMFERIYDTSKRYPRIVGVCVCSIYPNFNEQDCMTLCKNMSQRIDVVLKNGVTWPITKDFVSNLNKTKYMYLVSRLDS